ncbi:nucleolar complex protein-like protein [Delitschia confertaspora ATCC 74209]|uniref:Nucleolar complex protein-like protein n=1 Tax=Delitschia confertaspora ATCC 74209 TaxID=1513339 RepID=A0A9P4JIA1_9PLEO|nr:nucleolar complex protein-like protein [Delitschia confertaspora ATCC 74209]
MSGFETAAVAGHKRKRAVTKSDRKSTKTKTRRKSASPEELDHQAEILQLEAQIVESRRHYNNIATLLQKATGQGEKNEILAAVALCRVFSRLMSAGDMTKSKGMPESEVVIVQWLKDRYKEYVTLLLEEHFQSESGAKQSTALALLMRLVKQESGQKDFNWKRSHLRRVVEGLLTLPEGDSIRQEFAEKYLTKFDDVRYHTLESISSAMEYEYKEPTASLVKANGLTLLMALENAPASKDDLDNFFGERPTQSKSQLFSLQSHKARAQEAWLAVLRSGLSKEQRKTVLGAFTHQIAPWFQQVEMLMDFLTDSYNVGGATSLLALSGLYYLMSEKNLDYPSFFQKLYSLLDDTLLHSKHRSRFFRLLDTFMSSTHLPAALVASFIKRLARLALHGPPAGIVVVVPWIYNMFKRHPTCTFMIHREIRDPEIKKELEAEGMDDPFDMEEEDPMLTDAIESSLWEIETLQFHYHPNVATLAKIISEQFTKRSYNLEDFLDHSYNALLEAELDRDLKKPPVVEYEIPKRIFSADEGGTGPLGELLGKVIAMS